LLVLGPMKRISRIVVGTDFSECAEAALDYAVGVAEQTGATVTLVHAYEIPIYMAPDGTFMTATSDLVDKMSTAAETGLARERARLEKRGVLVRTVLRIGVPWEELDAVAIAEGADVIVVGTHGRRGVSRLLLGSVAERVVRSASRPVLVYRGEPPPERA